MFAKFPVTNKENVSQPRAGRHNDNKVRDLCMWFIISVAMVIEGMQAG